MDADQENLGNALACHLICPRDSDLKARQCPLFECYYRPLQAIVRHPLLLFQQIHWPEVVAEMIVRHPLLKLVDQHG